MKIIRHSCEDEMLLEYLKSELDSARFGGNIKKVLEELNLPREIISNGDFHNAKENKLRYKIMKKHRGYPTKLLFKGFPPIYKWDVVKFCKSDLNKIRFVRSAYWDALTNYKSKPAEAAKNIRSGNEFLGITNTAYLQGLEYLKHGKFPPITLITYDFKKFLLIEGHSRVTVYSMWPEKFANTIGWLGYCTKEDMLSYNPRMK